MVPAFAQSNYAIWSMRTGGALERRAGFDFEGIYTRVVPHQTIEYRMSDGREVQVEFAERPDGVHVTETFDPENENSPELQRQGWQAILDNFARHVEAKR